MEGLAFLAILGGIITTIIWIMIGWRAMRAHERLADALEQVARNLRDHAS